MKRMWPKLEDGNHNYELDVTIEYRCPRRKLTWEFNETTQVRRFCKKYHYILSRPDFLSRFAMTRLTSRFIFRYRSGLYNATCLSEIGSAKLTPKIYRELR